MSNPVSLRLYNVLGTTFDDDATTEALHTLSELYATPTTNGRDISTDVIDDEDDEDDGSVHQSAHLHETIPGESAARARKNLRRDMENKLTEGSRQFLKAFAEVDQKLDELQEHVTAMRADCDQAEAQLQLTTEASNTLLERAGSLRNERQEVETRKSIVCLFLAHFTLTDDEVEAMTSRDVPVGQLFFDAMDKTDRIRNDCRVLMAGEDGPTQSGLDIMASTSTYLEQGYEKNFRWCSFEFRQMGRDAQLEVGPIIHEAMQRLRKRPELLTEALTVLSQTRQQTLLSLFLTALTRGGPSGLPRPIELHAHDPMRYVGDMLAWVHQAIAAEHDFLEGLFGMKGDGRMVGSVRVFRAKGAEMGMEGQGEGEEEHWILELMDLAVGKLCVPLKVRVQQTVRSQESSIMLYKIANLLQFYMLTMRRTIGDEALLSKTLLETTEIAYSIFYSAIEAQGRALLRISLDLDDPSVTPPASILEHAQILREIATVYQSSLLGDSPSSTPVDHHQLASEVPETNDGAVGFQRILDVMVDPAVQMCETAAEEKRRLRGRWDREAFGINCLTYLQNVLEPFSFTIAKQRTIQELVSEQVNLLTEKHYENILADAGLSEVTVACQSRQPGEPLSHIPSTSPPALQSALHTFSLWLSGPEVVQSPRLAHLTVQRLHTQIHHAALERVANSYGMLCEEVRKGENKYEAASTLLGSERPFGQVHLLWQIFGLHDGENGPYELGA